MQNSGGLRSAFPFLLPALVSLFLVGLVPLAVVFFYSLHDTFGGNMFFWVGGQWFYRVISSQEFYAALLRSFSFSVLILSIQIPLGIYIALKMPRSGTLVAAALILLTIPMLTPKIVVGYLWKVMVQPENGLITQAFAEVGVMLDMNNVFWTWTILILMDLWHWTGLVVLLCYARLRTIPDAQYQAASIDGASRWSVFRNIELPKMRLVLAIAFLLRFMDSFTMYTEAYVITRGGPGVSTVFLSHELVQTGLIQFDLGEAGAMAVIYFVIVVLISALFYRIMLPSPLKNTGK
jgi:glycerol transport system permease protein